MQRLRYAKQTKLFLVFILIQSKELKEPLHLFLVSVCVKDETKRRPYPLADMLNKLRASDDNDNDHYDHNPQLTLM